MKRLALAFKKEIAALKVIYFGLSVIFKSGTVTDTVQWVGINNNNIQDVIDIVNLPDTWKGCSRKKEVIQVICNGLM